MLPLGILGSAHKAAPGGLADAILALSPAGYWKLNETSGTTAADSSGNGRNGTYTGTYTLAGRNGFATFAGGYVNIPDDNAWSPNIVGYGITVFAIAYVNAIGGVRQMIVAKGAASNYEWQMEVEASPGKGVATWFNGSGIRQHEASPTAWPVASWHALAFDLGTPPEAGARFPLYRDSGTALSTTQPYSMPGGPPINGTAPVRLAGRGDGVGALTGALAHVAIFPTELTAIQVGGLMSAAAAEGLI